MKLILSFCLTLISLGCYADGPVITGELIVFPGTIESYTVTWDQWDNTYENYANVTWDVTEGTIISSDKHSVTIQWNTLEGYFGASGSIGVSEDLGGQSGQIIITIENNVESTSDFCNGILGTPKIAVDFGSGTNPGPTLPTGTTGYQYNSSCALNVGEYTIRNNSNLCRGLWYNIPHDHTGSPNGYFLMINANDNRNVIYQSVVTGLTTSFRYEFSAWVGNLYINNSGQDPNIRFEIYDMGGTLIGTSGTIPIPVTFPSFQWQRVGFMFDVPPGVTSVQVVIVNTRRSTANEGNDMVIDDISFAPCLPGILASFSSTSIVDKEHTCNNGTVNLYSSWPSTIPFVNPSYQWQRSTDMGNSWSNISGATSINYSQIENLPGIFEYRMLSFETSNPSQQVISNSITYYVQTMVVEAHTYNFFSCQGYIPSGQVAGVAHFLYYDPAEASSLVVSYLWSPSTYINNPYVNPINIILPSATTPPSNGPPPPPTNYYYTFTATVSNYGCTASNTQTMSVYAPRKVGVASAFAPYSSNPVNRVLVPINIEDYPGSEYWVWNRWGNLIFHSQGPTKLDYTWDGTYHGVMQPMDVYQWAVSLTGCPTNIVSASNGDGIPYGDATLVR